MALNIFSVPNEKVAYELLGKNQADAALMAWPQSQTMIYCQADDLNFFRQRLRPEIAIIEAGTFNTGVGFILVDSNDTDEIRAVLNRERQE